MSRPRVFRLPAAFLLGWLGLGLAAGSAGATASTHIWAPSTDVQPFKRLHLTSDLYVPIECGPSGARLQSVTNFGLTCGVLPFKKLNLELGVDHKTGYAALDAYPVYFNAKLGIPENGLFRFCPALAGGILDAGTKGGMTNFNVAYAKAAMMLGDAGRVSIGYFDGSRKLLVNAQGMSDAAGVMAAWERTVPEISDKLWLCVDYMGTRSVYGTLNLGGSWKFADNVAVLAAYDIYNDSQLSPNTITIQVDIDFGISSGGS